MLVSIIANLMQEGGIIPPVIPPHGGGGEIDFGLQGGKNLSRDEEAILRRKKLLDQDEEDWILFIHTFIVSQNKN